jgi:hypothetical protein
MELTVKTTSIEIENNEGRKAEARIRRVTMSVEIGIISAASGVVQAVNPVTGEVRVLMVGDPVYLDEVLSTGIRITSLLVNK